MLLKWRRNKSRDVRTALVHNHKIKFQKLLHSGWNARSWRGRNAPEEGKKRVRKAKGAKWQQLAGELFPIESKWRRNSIRFSLRKFEGRTGLFCESVEGLSRTVVAGETRCSLSSDLLKCFAGSAPNWHQTRWIEVSRNFCKILQWRVCICFWRWFCYGNLLWLDSKNSCRKRWK